MQTKELTVAPLCACFVRLVGPQTFFSSRCTKDDMSCSATVCRHHQSLRRQKRPSSLCTRYTTCTGAYVLHRHRQSLHRSHACRSKAFGGTD